MVGGKARCTRGVQRVGLVQRQTGQSQSPPEGADFFGALFLKRVIARRTAFADTSRAASSAGDHMHSPIRYDGADSSTTCAIWSWFRTCMSLMYGVLMKYCVPSAFMRLCSAFLVASVVSSTVSEKPKYLYSVR